MIEFFDRLISRTRGSDAVRPRLPSRFEGWPSSGTSPEPPREAAPEAAPARGPAAPYGTPVDWQSWRKAPRDPPAVPVPRLADTSTETPRAPASAQRAVVAVAASAQERSEAHAPSAHANERSQTAVRPPLAPAPHPARDPLGHDREVPVPREASRPSLTKAAAPARPARSPMPEIEAKRARSAEAMIAAPLAGTRIMPQRALAQPPARRIAAAVEASVYVSIGRVEVRMARESSETRRDAREDAGQTAMSLAEYLRSRAR